MHANVEKYSHLQVANKFVRCLLAHDLKIWFQFLFEYIINLFISTRILRKQNVFFPPIEKNIKYPCTRVLIV